MATTKQSGYATVTTGDMRAATGTIIVADRPKLCINCKWISHTWADRLTRFMDKEFSSYKCLHPQSPDKKDDSAKYIVGGGPTRYCSIMRKYGPCGTDAKLYEERKS